MEEQVGARKGRRTRQDALLMALVVVGGTLLLLWGGDWLARRGAEALLARTLQQETGVADRPEVDVHGSFFLAQVLRGRYEQVDLTFEGVSSGPLRIDSVSAELTDVYLPFSDLLRGRADQIVIATSRERAVLTYADLNRYLELTGRPVEVATGGGDQVELTGSVDVLGRTLEASADARLGADDGALVVEPERVGAARELDRVSSLLLGQRFSFRVPLDPLPFAQQLTDVRATPEGIRVDAAGTGVVIEP